MRRLAFVVSMFGLKRLLVAYIAFQAASASSTGIALDHHFINGVETSKVPRIVALCISEKMKERADGGDIAIHQGVYRVTSAGGLTVAVLRSMATAKTVIHVDSEDRRAVLQDYGAAIKGCL